MPNNQSPNKENMVYIHSGVLLSHKEEWNYAICRKLDGTEEHHIQ
jgi:hypothetical protein